MVFQNRTDNYNKKHTLVNKTTPKLMEYKMCPAICILTQPHIGKVCIFLPILLLSGCYIWLIHYCALNIVVGVIVDYVSWKHHLKFK